MVAPLQHNPGPPKAFLVIAPALGLTSIWMLGLHNPRPDFLGTMISSVCFLIIFFGIMGAMSWKRKKNRQQKIRGAVLSRPRPPGAEDPPA